MTIKKNLLSLIAGFLTSATVFAANTVTTVSQVTDGVTVSGDVDYTITNDTLPFTTTGSVDITNINHGVVILKGIKPSKVLSTWLKNHVYINGKQAVNNSNCQVKMYAEGTIILPYTTASIKPLTVYTEKDYGGTSANWFRLENSGGFMNTLPDSLNNRIRSFKLKRGYMVTFSTRASGRGYSRCFIAANEDLEVASLPNVLNGTITSYRVFEWYDASKKGLANNTGSTYNDALNTTSCYGFGGGESRLPDQECIPHHIYENWPSASALGSATYSCHMKTNNEPGNSADDHPQDVATVLAGWEDLMRTGMRLCSESSHDGSWSHLRAFIDSIDARGWRCDILDLHCYWGSSSFGDFSNYYSSYGNRPIWISEWCWGASWNSSNWSSGGIFAQAPDGAGSYSLANQNCMYNGTKPILDKLNASKYVERYYFWNSENTASHLIAWVDNKDSVSVLGKYYASMKPGIGYNPSIQKIPNNPRVYAPGNLKADYDKIAGKVTLTWHEYNGEYNKIMCIDRRASISSAWVPVDTIALNEVEDDYTYTIEGVEGMQYSIRVIDVNNATKRSNVATASSDSQEYGDPVSVAGNTMYLGGNQLINGDFELGMADWQNGAGKDITAPYFQVVPEGGIDGGAYLQCYGDASNSDATAAKTSEQALRRVFKLTPDDSYFISAAGCNNVPSYQRFSSSQDGLLENTKHLELPALTTWTRQSAAFTVTEAQPYLTMQFRHLGGDARFDDMKVCKCFATREEALADALNWEKKRVDLFISYNTWYPDLNTDVLGIVASGADANVIEKAIKDAIDTIKVRKLDAAYKAVATKYNGLIPEDVDYILNTTAVQYPTFLSTIGWITACGTYTGGDQRTATQDGKNCWNAWWNITAAGNENQTMAIKQTVTKTDASTTTKLSGGLYALECNATTQHYCETDQHAFISHGTEKAQSIPLQVGKLDLANFTDKWENLVTSYIYINDGDTLTVGFEGSKKGAVDGTYITAASTSPSADNRNGWWCATDFKLRYYPACKKTSDSKGWGTICLPRTISIPEGVTLYSVKGMLSDSTAICVEEVTEPVKGYPYIFKTTPNTEVLFIHSGDALANVPTNINGLRGVWTYSATSKYPLAALLLKDGAWTVTTERTVREAYSSCIYSTASSSTTPKSQLGNLTRLDSWDGVTIPTSGLVAAKKVTGDESGDGVVNVLDINAAIAKICSNVTPTYTIDTIINVIIGK